MSTNVLAMQWTDLEPAEGSYDFAPLEAALRALGDKPATLQVNGNRKPAWLFDVVPLCQDKLGEQVADKQGTLMYWHPRHQQAYLNFLRAYGDFVKAAPWREQVLGIRLNFNALGTEHWRVAAEDRDLGKWITPPGATTGTAWTMEAGTTYRTEVLRAFVDAFTPTVRVFVRNNIEPELREPFEARFRSGELAWFHTSTEIEPRAAWGERQYQTFLDYCRNGTTVGYAEQWASAWGHHGGVTDPRWCSPPQWNYWRLLADLHCGVSFRRRAPCSRVLVHRWPHGRAFLASRRCRQSPPQFEASSWVARVGAGQIKLTAQRRASPVRVVHDRSIFKIRSNCVSE